MDHFLNLKICESCGCLWLRAHLEASVYCAPCYERLKQFPAVSGRRRRGRRPKITIPTLHAVDARTLPDDFDFHTHATSDGAAHLGGLQ
jgi:hypothetical protein